MQHLPVFRRSRFEHNRQTDRHRRPALCARQRRHPRPGLIIPRILCRTARHDPARCVARRPGDVATMPCVGNIARNGACNERCCRPVIGGNNGLEAGEVTVRGRGSNVTVATGHSKHCPWGAVVRGASWGARAFTTLRLTRSLFHQRSVPLTECGCFVTHSAFLSPWH